VNSKSILVISSNLEALNTYAKKESSKYKSADIFWLRPLEGEKSIGVKETILFMQQAYLAPVGNGKLMIICDISTMTPQAQNKILKTVEDTPANTTFLLLGSNADVILNTVKSRCQTIYLPTPRTARLVPDETLKNLKEVFGINFDESSLTTKQRQGILNCIAKMNATKQQDLLLLEIVKNAKNS